MELYWKAIGAALITLVLGQAIREKDLSLLLGMAGCILVGLLMMTYLEPVLAFLRKLQELGDIQGNMLEILLKALGIGILTEITEMLCRDSGSSSLGRSIGLLGTAVILWLSLPIFSSLLDLLQSILGEV